MRYVVKMNDKEVDIVEEFTFDDEVHEIIKDNATIRENLRAIAPQIDGIGLYELVAIIDVLTEDLEYRIINKMGTVELNITNDKVELYVPIYSEECNIYNQEYIPCTMRYGLIRGY